MPSTRNIQLLQTIADQLHQARAVYLVDHHGLTANDLTTLRAQIRQADGQLVVVKNTLLAKALRQLPTDHPCFISSQPTTHNPQPTGTTAALFAMQDQIQPLKVVIKYAQGKDMPTLKSGLLEHRVLTMDQVMQLAKLPGIDQLRAQAVGMLASPMSRLLSTLNGSLQKLVFVLNLVKEQKSN